MRSCDFSKLNAEQVLAYKSIVSKAFPEVIFQSAVVQDCWDKIEQYFPEYQVFILNEDGNILGFINSIPVRFDSPIEELPDSGWDWLVNEGIDGFEQGVEPNCIGGLQIIVNQENQGQGLSQKLIELGKKIQLENKFKNFIIPIRPTFKSKFPQMPMDEYIVYKEKDKIYDPWIRTHLRNGAQIISVCHNAMNITGDINCWENMMDQKITKTGYYIVKGALNPVFMNIEKDYGEYREANIWINYQNEFQVLPA